MVGRTSRMSGSGHKAIPNVREWSGGPHGNPGVVGGLPGCLGVVRKPSWKSGGPSWITGSGREALTDVREWSENHPRHPRGPPGHPGGPSEPSRTFERASTNSWTTGRDSRTSGRASQPLQDICEGLPTTVRHPEGTPNHSRTSKRATRPFLDIRVGFPTTPGHPGRLPATPRHPGGPPDHSRTFGIAFRPISDIR